MVSWSPGRLLLIAGGIAAAGWTMARCLGAEAAVIPGLHLGDNVTGLWNTWWFVQAPGGGIADYRTDMLFAPWGTQLSLHTHATTHALLAWPFARITSIGTAHNVALFAGVALNALCAGLLCFRLTGALGASAAAGLLFAFSAFPQLRLLGHVNLAHAWVLPLFALALLRVERSPSRAAAALLGAAGALVVYTDYYYAVYASVLALVWAVWRTLRIGARLLAPRAPRLRASLLVLAAVALSVAGLIWLTGGTSLQLAGLTVSLRGARNPLTATWLLLGAWVLFRFPFALSISRRAGETRRRSGVLLISLPVFLVLVAPLAVAVAGVIANGEYTTQRVLWRSSPPGGDLLTLIAGSPRHIFAGQWTTTLYERLGIDVMEQTLWVGLVPILIVAAAWRSLAADAHARFWTVVAVVFFLLALGPFLRFGGVDVGLPLPHALMRYVPGFSNARIPGRAIVMVNLAIAVLMAFALAARRRRLSTRVLLCLLALETLPAPAPAVAIPRQDGVDAAIARSDEAGAVVELPLGLRDGFGEVGALEHRALAHQMWHGRPLAGGFVARLSPAIRARYEGTPLLSNLLKLSTRAEEDVALMADAAARARDLDLAFLVINRDTFVDARIPRATLEAAGFRLLAADGARELYGVH